MDYQRIESAKPTTKHSAPTPRYCHPVIITGSSLSVKLWRLFSHWQARSIRRCAKPIPSAIRCKAYRAMMAMHLPRVRSTSAAVTFGVVVTVVAFIFVCI